jgi:hypothetical protein
MLYDPERTRGIVDRMVLLGNNLRPFTITLSAVNFGLLFGILGALVFRDSWFVLALVGVIVGFCFGIFLASALAVLLEWMAQVLIRLDTRP